MVVDGSAFWMAELADAIIRAVFQAAEVARIAGDRSPQGLTDDGERMVPEFHRGTYVYAEHMARYLLSAAFVRDRRVLDVACGSGYGVEILSDAGARHVVGLDVAPKAALYGHGHFAGPRTTFLVGEGGSLPFADAPFDVVVSFETIEHVPDYHLFLAEVRRVLKPKGLFIVSTPNKGVYPEGNPYHFKEFRFGEFEEVLRSYFKEVAMMPQDNWVANAILPPAEFQRDTGPIGGGVSAFKVTGRESDTALYAVAICSDAELPPIEPKLVVAGVVDAEYVSREMARYQMEHERSQITIAEREAELEQRRLLLAERDEQLGEREQQVRGLMQERDNICGSTGYRLLERCRRGLRWLFPDGSWRRVPYQAALSLVKFVAGSRGNEFAVSRRQRLLSLPKRAVLVIRREGWRAFFSKVKRRLGGPTFGGQPPQIEMEQEVTPLIFPKPHEPLVSIVIPVFNKSVYTFNCLLSVLRNTDDVAFEVIVVDDASTDDTQSMLAQIENIRVLTNPRNMGFVHTCNNGALSAEGKYLVFLNNDAQVHKGWLDALIDVVEDDASAGLVGAKLLFPDGRLQEAGGIVWRDASAWNYGRLDDPEKPEYNYVREVDYCSGACLLVRRELFEKVGGFDLLYAPAYYEDTDLAFSVRKLGYRVVYQPRAVVTHFEGITAGTDTSSGTKRFQEVNRHKFRDKWRDVLDREHLPNGRDVLLARDRRRADRVLVADHFVPSFDRDAGSLRMYQMLKILTELGLVVTFVPDNMSRNEPYTSSLQEIGIEVLYGPMDVTAHLRDLGTHLRLAVLSRPDVAALYVPLVRRCAPNATLIYDTVDLHFVREERRADVEGSHDARKSSERYRHLELALANSSDATLVVTEAEKQLLLELSPGLNVHVIPTIHETHMNTVPRSKRQGVLFVGSFLHPPNVDAARYLVRDILPLIKREIEDVTLYIVGADPTPEIKALASERVVVTGWVKDISLYLKGARVMVAPLRYGAGLKGKISQGMSYGLPMVTTSLGIEGMDIEDGTEALVADDPAEFAAKVIRVYRDDDLWNHLAEHAARFAAANYSPEVVRTKLIDVLQQHGVKLLSDSKRALALSRSG